MTCLPVRFPIARISRGCTIRQFISGVLALPTLLSVVWFGAFGMGVGLPFFVFGYLQIYSLMRALREDAGEVGVLHTRRWHRVLPPEEFQRRSEEGSLTGAAVVAPDYVHGTEPENAPEIEHPEQPEFVLEHHESTGTLPAVRPQD